MALIINISEYGWLRLKAANQLIRSVTEEAGEKSLGSEDKRLRKASEWRIVVFNHESKQKHEDEPVSTQTIREYLECLWKQYQKADRKTRGAILDEISRNLGIHRKSATRLMCRRYAPRSLQGFKGGRKRRYSELAKRHLERLWRAMGFMWPQRMKAALKDWLPHDDHPECSESVKVELLQMSASTIGRLLKEARAELRRRLNTGTKRAVRRFVTEVPLRNLGETPPQMPGHCEVDCVAHCGGSLSGVFAWTVNFTDIATGWTECEAIWGKNGVAVRRALKAIERRLPFPMKALYFDNGNEFLNEDVIRGFAVKDRKEPLNVFRGRPYKKNDQCFIEQKNYTHVRSLWGYGRFDKEASVALMNDIYRKEWRQMQNFYCPQQKLVKKLRFGAKVKRTMDDPETPFSRLKPLLGSAEASALDLARSQINPFKCRHNQRVKLRRILRDYEGEMAPSEWGKMANA